MCAFAVSLYGIYAVGVKRSFLSLPSSILATS